MPLCPFKLSLHPSGGANAPTGLHQILLQPCIAIFGSVSTDEAATICPSFEKNDPKNVRSLFFAKTKRSHDKHITVYGKHVTLLRIKKSLSTYKATANWNLQGTDHLHKKLRHTKDSHVEMPSILCVLTYTSYQRHLKNALI